MFPFDQPGPTAFYLVLYLLTFVLHQALMHYVVAGSLYVAWTVIFPGSADGPRTKQPLAELVRDWMPFSLGAAITAGVAPLLFVQILYQKQFYTANLLLGWRWMMVIPILILAFYILYLQKSAKLVNWPRFVRANCSLVAAVCFLFVGFCWTVNHSIGNQESQWADIYVSGSVPLTTTVWLRMGIWIGGAFPSLAVIAGWQFAGRRSRAEADGPACDRQARTLAALSIGGLTVAGVSAAVYSGHLSSEVNDALLGTAGLPWLLIAIVGVALQLLGWAFQFRQACFCRKQLTMVTTGWLAALLGVAALREIIRVKSIRFDALYERHAESIEIGGLFVFLLFAVMNIALIVFCIRTVRLGRKDAGENTVEPDASASG